VIFVTVGTQLPFDRLVGAVDEWAGMTGEREIFAQTGPTQHPPRRLAWAPFLSPREHAARLEAASLVVAHAGIGTILSSLSRSKPLLIMPRRAAFGEQRNDHQLATATRFSGRPGIHVAMDEDELIERLGAIDDLVAGQAIPAHASRELIEAVRAFIVEGRLPRPALPAEAEPPVVVTRPATPVPTAREAMPK
jgi:exopolysaccharide biosynthesis glucuronosyltransferase PssE